jgi:hypothetical protein
MLARGLRWLRAELAFVLVVAAVVAAAGYLVLFPGHWRRGTGVISLALLAAGVLRFVLPPPHVGMLAVRGRWRDTLCYLGIGGVILAVAIRLH